jgi:hypothetical protein
MSVTTQAFKNIAHFISDIHTDFGPRMKTLRLYNRLLSKITSADVESMEVHVRCFQNFFAQNSRILERVLDQPVVQYSERIYVNIKSILEWSNGEQTSIIWKHLLFIHAILNPQVRDDVKQVISQLDNEDKNRENKNSTDLLKNMFGKIQKSIPQGTDDPLVAVTSLLSSGAMSEIIGMVHKGMAEGTLDPKKIIGNLPGLMDQLDIPQDVKDGMRNQVNPDQMNQMMSSVMGLVGGILPNLGGLVPGGAPSQLTLEQATAQVREEEAHTSGAHSNCNSDTCEKK